MKFHLLGFLKIGDAVKIIPITLAMAFTATAAFAGQLGSGGVASIKNNGTISGNPSYTITCSSGWGVVIRNGNKWTDSSGNTYSDRLWSLSLNDFSDRMCD